MKLSRISLTTLSVWLVLVTTLPGCVSTPNTRFYLYKGLPKGQNDVAVIVTQEDMLVYSIVDASTGDELLGFSAENPSPIPLPYILDLLPGEYILEAGYLDSGVSAWSAGDPVVATIKAQAGGIYYLYHKDLPSNKWQIVIEVFSDIDDLMNYRNKSTENKEDGVQISNRVSRHFNAENYVSVSDN